MKEIIHKNRNKIICFIVTLILALITIYAVFKGSGISPDELVSSLRESSWEGIVPAAVSMLGFIWFEGDALRVILRHMGYPVKRSQGFIYSAADVYFSAITPSASGGQPASAFFMVQDGIPVTAVMTALLLNLIMYTLAIISISIADILIFPKIFLNFSIACRILIVAGGVILAGLGILFYMLLRKQELMKSICLGITGLLHRLHCHRLAGRIERKLSVSLEKYSHCVDAVLGGTQDALEGIPSQCTAANVTDHCYIIFLRCHAWRSA